MSSLLRTIIGKSPLNSVSPLPDTDEGKLGLPTSSEEPLLDGKENFGKCELRIEGMTCGACVEVRYSLSLCSGSMTNQQLPQHSPSRECCAHNQASIPSKLPFWQNVELLNTIPQYGM
jgi:hypothetical protein